MKKRILQLGGCLLSALLLGGVVHAATADEELQAVRDKVSGMFKEIEPRHVNPGPIDGWYTVAKGAIVAYISADGRYLMQGELIDLEQNVNLTEDARSTARVEMMSAIPDEELIVFTPEEIKYSVSVFTDIDCTFCRRLHAQIDEYLAAGIQVRYLLYPRNGPASASWVKAERVWCADNRNEALTKAKLDEQFQTRDCDASVVHSHYAAGQDVGLRGTPAIVTEDGTLVSGYMEPAELSNALARSAK
ncbi:MAG: DsbC family protein [Gammaproteobacteria bacterium]|nr:DsbC family protein [Gammaproteobacteria bacterium]